MLEGKTIVITGGSRGIGQAIGVRAARDGANIAIWAKTDRPHPRLPGTIHTAAEAVREAGGQALPLVVDVRDEAQIEQAVARTVERFGGIDALVNNASAIRLTDTPSTEIKRYDLMHAVNVRGTFLCTQKCLPALREADNPHVLNISPPLSLEPRWFAPHVAYTMTKFGMSLCVLGMAEEFREAGIAVNALWPKTAIDTAAVRNELGGEEMARHARKPEIMADAAHAILSREAELCSGNFFIDEAVLREEGVTDFEPYAVEPGTELFPDFFL